MRSRNLSAIKLVASTAALLSALPSLASAHAHLSLPNGGEVLTVGSVYTIVYEVELTHPTENWDLWYSTTGAAGPFIPIAMDLPAGSLVKGDPHTFDWTVPDTPSTQVIVRVRMDTLGTDYFDESDAVLTIAPAPDPFLSFCFGDGGDQLGCTECPCLNNAPVGTPGGCLNSASSSARLIPGGDASVSLPAGASTDLRFDLAGAPSSAFCILTSGAALAPQNGSNPCFGTGNGVLSPAFDGLRCAVQDTRRHGGRAADSNGDVGVTGSPWGGSGGPMAGIAQAGIGFTSGQTRYFQVIYRDDPLVSCMRGLNTSQAVEVTFEP